MTRKEANLEILRWIKTEIEQFPDMRFGQILRNLDIVASHFNKENCETEWVNGFYEEPEKTLQRMKETARKLASLQDH